MTPAPSPRSSCNRRRPANDDAHVDDPHPRVCLRMQACPCASPRSNGIRRGDSGRVGRTPRRERRRPYRPASHRPGQRRRWQRYRRRARGIQRVRWRSTQPCIGAHRNRWPDRHEGPTRRNGRYPIVATTHDKTGKPLHVAFTAIALDYQQTLGRELSEKHCARCHDARSTAERVSNLDNLSAQPHAFSDGATLNEIGPANLVAIVGHGGVAVGKSPEMPPYSPTLSAVEIDALAAYIRAVADPPYSPRGLVDANRTKPPPNRSDAGN